MMRIGIDLSLNSTGIAVETRQGKWDFYIILPRDNTTKKIQTYTGKEIVYCQYDKSTADKNASYNEKEFCKSVNISAITTEILNIIKKYHQRGISYGDMQASIEGISFGSRSTTALAELSGLNHHLRIALMERGVAFNIVTPMSNKKFAVGNGGADKLMMVDAFVRLQPQMANAQQLGLKIDDVADAFFLAQCNC